MTFNSVSVRRPYEQIVEQTQNATRGSIFPRESTCRSEYELVDQLTTLSWFDLNQNSDSCELVGEFDTRSHLSIAQAYGNPYLEVAMASVPGIYGRMVALFAEHSGPTVVRSQLPISPCNRPGTTV